MTTNPELVNALAAIAGTISGSQPQPQLPAQLGSTPTSASEGINSYENLARECVGVLIPAEQVAGAVADFRKWLQRSDGSKSVNQIRISRHVLSCLAGSA